MDDQRFDELVKRFCTTRLTRLSALRGLAGGAAAAMTGALLASGESEAKKARGQSHKKARGQRKKKSRAQSKKRNGTQSNVQSGSVTVLDAGSCREVGHPCQGNQNCCPNIESCVVTGPGNAKRCANQTECGALNQPCCNGDCQLGLECDNGTCVDPDTECGEIDQPCCEPNNTCDPGGVCDTETDPESPVCVECGDEGEPCCTNNTCNEDDLTCSTEGTCVHCGEIDEPCCEGEFCDPDAVCDPEDGPDGTCINCGAENEPCCVPPDDLCDTGLTCNQDDICVPTPPDECGALGQPCCPDDGDGCDDDLVCDDSQNPPDGICVECIDDAECADNSVCCGNACFPGECCGNEDCVGNETCNANHECVGPTPPPPGPTSCPADAVLIGGRCVFLGLRCKTTETPLKCCFRAVAKGCKRKQQSAQARKNCLKRGKKRCKKLLTGV